MLLLLVILTVIEISCSQISPNCPLSGPIYPAPIDALHKSSSVPNAIRTFNDSIHSALQNGTLSAANISCQVEVFSTDGNLFDFSYTSLGANASLTSGTLDRNTVFRTGSIGKLLAVYSLLAADGLDHINDPVTKWVPELAVQKFENDIDTPRWEDISIKALASHLAGVRDCR
jgi:hypothetical protein